MATKYKSSLGLPSTPGVGIPGTPGVEGPSQLLGTPLSAPPVTPIGPGQKKGDYPVYPPLNPIQQAGKKPKAPFSGPATYQGPSGDVLPVPVNQKGKIKDKYISDFEKELIFAYRPGQFPATPEPTAYERGVFDPNSPNAFDTKSAFSPEFNEQLLGFVQRPLEEQRDEATRGLSERFANLGRVGAGRFGRGAINIQKDFGQALSDAVTRIALQQSLAERAERLLSEERGYTSSEAERDRRFGASQKGLDRRLQRQLAGAGGGAASFSTPAAIAAGGGGGIGQDLLAAIAGGAAGKFF